MSACVNHPNREAAVKCRCCLKPVCEECIIQLKGINYCSDACAISAETTGKELDEAARRLRRKRLIKKLITLLILGIILAGLAYYFLVNRRQSELLLKQINELLPDDEDHETE